MIRQQPNPTLKPTFFRSPGAMGYACDHVFRNPVYRPDSAAPFDKAQDVPLLIRCHAPAKSRIVLFDGQCVYVVKRCAACADILKAQIAKGVKLEILNEEVIDVTR